MNYKDRWDIVGELGEGGQGKVYRVLDKQRFSIDEGEAQRIVAQMAAARHASEVRHVVERFRDLIRETLAYDDPACHGALKVLHNPEDARDAERAEERLRDEMKAMADSHHPHLLRILDLDVDEHWFVSEYHPNGTLDEHGHRFKGDFRACLRAILPLVEGVAALHGRDMVHRDIKPKNIFVDSSGQLVLGDFGLVFFGDPDHTRLSATLENVGSRDWMPTWAEGVRLDKVKPSFDVFSLGKVLWSMLAGQPKLQLWYYDDPRFNVEVLFAGRPHMAMANQLLKRCIVQHEGDCINDASSLARTIRALLRVIDRGADLVGAVKDRTCRACGQGKYMSVVNRDPDLIRDFGIQPADPRTFKVFVCDHCGHVDMFTFASQSGVPGAWLEL